MYHVHINVKYNYISFESIHFDSDKLLKNTGDLIQIVFKQNEIHYSLNNLSLRYNIKSRLHRISRKVVILMII